MSTLIQPHYGDLHAEALRWALTQLGETAYTWVVSDFPDKLQLTLKFDNGKSCDSRNIWHQKILIIIKEI